MQDSEEYVVLVNKQGERIGVSPKLLAHQKGMLHRAFSIFIFNAYGQLLIHQRNPQKYHSGGLWTNTCCSHPRANETVMSAATRRLQEEMGLSSVLEEVFSFSYKKNLANGLIEHEFDHVLVGYSDHQPSPDENEVSDWCWIGLRELQIDIKTSPEKYTCWFPMALKKLNEHDFSAHALSRNSA